MVVNTHFPCPYFYILVIDDDGGDDDDDQKAKGKRPSDAATNIEGVPAQSQGQPHNPIFFSNLIFILGISLGLHFQWMLLGSSRFSWI